MTNILRFAGLALISFLLLTGCGNEPQRLPYLGNVEIKGADTLYPTVPDITLTDQDSQTYRISTLNNKIILADFFFTSCPSICPKVKKQMTVLPCSTDMRIT